MIGHGDYLSIMVYNMLSGINSILTINLKKKYDGKFCRSIDEQRRVEKDNLQRRNLVNLRPPKHAL